MLQRQKYTRIRKNFGKIRESAEIPDLIELQSESFKKFLQLHVAPESRERTGLQDVLASTFPIKEYSGRAELHFHSYSIDEPKYSIEECQVKGLTYSAALRVVFRLVVWDIDENTGTKTVKNIKEQEVFMGDIPLMTPMGTFLINGIERVIVSQMHRSPGVFFDHDHGKTHSSGKYLFSARVIPYRGSWIDFEFDAKDLLYVRIDRKRKFLASTLLMALEGNAMRVASSGKLNSKLVDEVSSSSKILPGLARDEILKLFYDTVSYTLKDKGSKHDKPLWKREFHPEEWRGLKPNYDLIDAKTGEIIVKADTRITNKLIKSLQEANIKEILVSPEQLIGAYNATDLVNPNTGEIYLEAGEEISYDILNTITANGIKEVSVLAIDHLSVGAHFRNTVMADKNTTREEALAEIYRILRPGEPSTPETADLLFKSQFFDPERYDLSTVGRVKMNARLDLGVSKEMRVLLPEDIIAIMKYLLKLKDGHGLVDDIDSLSNRRVRCVGELLENQFRIGLMRMEKSIRERMLSLDIDAILPNDLINAKPISVAIREFFVASPLSQFIDQHNPLSEVTHKRRVSALGPGGLSRDRAGLEVRDVHPTHYGRICPVETPEGPNIGLIVSLASYARINEYGFIETPYRYVKDGKVQKEVVYMSAMEESKHNVAQSSTPIDEDGNIISEKVSCRSQGEFIMLDKSEVTLIDVSPRQIASVAAALIPFLEHDDANRALMGSNMQRQAVPLLNVEAPLVGTGLEGKVAYDSGVMIKSKTAGVVDYVDANRIVVRPKDYTDNTPVHIYNLRKFSRSNHSTCINQRPLVRAGDVVNEGDILADGPSTDRGELGLGKNVLVAFIPWYGYTFEDSIVISQRLVRDDVYTSIHIEEFEVMARDTKLGNEEITRDIPNVSDEALRNLDESGIVSIGSEVNAGDILVGKITPRSESQATAEERLLRAIFGTKASDVRDTSLRMPPGFSGTVIDVRISSRRGIDKDDRTEANERAQTRIYAQERDTEKEIIEDNFYTRLKEVLNGQVLKANVGEIAKGTQLDLALLDSLPRSALRNITVKDPETSDIVAGLKKALDKELQNIEKTFLDRCTKLSKGDEMPPGVMKIVKVLVAVKRKLQAGDKMAGRHGNKGVVSLIVPEEDMPFLEDGTPVDMIFNPLGVPPRMNVGQILETHLGWAARGLGKMISQMCDQYHAGAAKIQELRKKLLDIYGQDNETIVNASDEEILAIAEDCRDGVYMATPVFDGAEREEIAKYLEMAGLDPSGQVWLRDGRTGELFKRKVTVGIKNVSKLHHLVDDKIHSRSTGPYSLVTQQPLGGKAQFGGQRFGEMEVWALQAYGAAHILQEMLTIKSDDVDGRVNAYHAIIEGNKNFKVGLPESFNVLVRELKSLAINLEFSVEEDRELEEQAESEVDTTAASAA